MRFSERQSCGFAIAFCLSPISRKANDWLLVIYFPATSHQWLEEFVNIGFHLIDSFGSNHLKLQIGNIGTRCGRSRLGEEIIVEAFDVIYSAHYWPNRLVGKFNLINLTLWHPLIYAWVIWTKREGWSEKFRATENKLE